MSNIVSSVPMLLVAALTCVGVVVAEAMSISLWSSLFAMAMGGLLSFWGVSHRGCEREMWVGFVVAVLSIGGVSYGVWRDSNTPPPHGESLWSVRVLSENRVDVQGWRDGDDEWHNFEQRLYYATNVVGGFDEGEEVEIYANWRGLHRGGGFVYLGRENILSRQEGSLRFVERVNRWATERVERLGLSPRSEALVKSMVLGDRAQIAPNTMEAYRDSGVMHILALSGLHLAIVYLVISAMVSWMVMLPRGYVWRYVVAIVLVWLYALVVGMPASVVRAATMFTIYLVSRAWSLPYSGVNALATTIFLVAVVSPVMLWSVGFQLSALAAGAILLWLPLWGYCRNVFVESLRVAVVCTVALTPLLSHTFGYISLLGFVAAPVILITGYVLVVCGAVWIVVPYNSLQQMFLLPMEGCAMVQNRVVECIASLGWGVVDMRAPADVVLMVYALYGVVTILLWLKK